MQLPKSLWNPTARRPHSSSRKRPCDVTGSTYPELIDSQRKWGWNRSQQTSSQQWRSRSIRDNFWRPSGILHRSRSFSPVGTKERDSRRRGRKPQERARSHSPTCGSRVNCGWAGLRTLGRPIWLWRAGWHAAPKSIRCLKQHRLNNQWTVNMARYHQVSSTIMPP